MARVLTLILVLTKSMDYKETCTVARYVSICSLLLTLQAVWRGYLARHGGKGKGKGKGKMAKKPSKKKK